VLSQLCCLLLLAVQVSVPGLQNGLHTRRGGRAQCKRRGGSTVVSVCCGHSVEAVSVGCE
jgi:hypothetical protein